MAQINQQQLIDLVALNGQQMVVTRAGEDAALDEDSDISPNPQPSIRFTVNGLLLETTIDKGAGETSIMFAANPDYTPIHEDIITVGSRNYTITEISPIGVSGITNIYTVVGRF